MTELEYYDEKAERHLDANGFSDREWLWLKIGAAAVTAMALIGCGYLVGWLG